MSEKSQITTFGRYKCDRCGKRFRRKERRDYHRRRCGRGDGAFADTDACPMCGEPYDSYTDHLAECDPNG